ncbi:MAG: SDR family NAD(P)-dependent oxidoreductase [Caulobacteraceae bacterium]
MTRRDGVVLITGASAGLGAQFARAYAARGRDLALVARRVDRLEALAGELSAAHGVRARVIGADLAEFGVETRVLAALAGEPVDILVNNAGYSIPQSFAAVPWSAQRDFLMTLVVSAAGLAHGVVPGMVARGGGGIINVASLAGLGPGMAGHTLYPAVKAWAIKFSQSLAEEYRENGLRVTALCPGFVRTEIGQVNGTQGAMDAMPRFLFQDPAPVIDAAIRANEKGRVVVVPGWHNKLSAGLFRLLPEHAVMAMVRAGSARFHLGG